MHIFVVFCFVLLRMVLPGKAAPQAAQVVGVHLANETPKFNQDVNEPMCGSMVSVTYPETMRNLKNVAKFIVNSDGYKQAVVTERCTGSKCDERVVLPIGYEPVCVQKYANVRLLTINADPTAEAAFDDFAVPTACVCVMKKVDV